MLLILSKHEDIPKKHKPCAIDGQNLLIENIRFNSKFDECLNNA